MKNVLFLIPFIGAATGWVIIAISLRLLFWPREIKQVGARSFQGLIPRKRKELALGVREIIETQLKYAVSQDLGPAPELISGMTDAVVQAARERLEERIPALVPRGIRLRIALAVEDIIRKEIPSFVDRVAVNTGSGNGGVDLCRWVENRINEYDLLSLENKLLKSREAVYLQVFAAFLGFVSGLLQLLIVWLART